MLLMYVTPYIFFFVETIEVFLLQLQLHWVIFISEFLLFCFMKK